MPQGVVLRKTSPGLIKHVLTVLVLWSSDFAICNCDAHRGPQKSQRFPRQDKGGELAWPRPRRPPW